MKARELFDLHEVNEETREMWNIKSKPGYTVVGDGFSVYSVKSEGLEEEINFTKDNLMQKYDTWCIKWDAKSE